MWTRSSSITLGTIFYLTVRFSKNFNDCEKLLHKLEKTRYRKKPSGSGRLLLDQKYVYLFNAWYFSDNKL